MVTPSAAAAARDRYSIAFFVNPDAGVVVAAHPRTVAAGAAAGAYTRPRVSST